VISLAIIDRQTSRVLSTLLIWALILLLIYVARRPILVVVFAIVFAYVLEPAIIRMEPWLKGGRIRAVAGTYVLILIFIAALLIFVSPRVASEAQNLGHNLPALLEKVNSGQIAYQLGRSHGWSYSTQAKLQQLIVTHRQQIIDTAHGIGTHAAEVAANIGWVLLVPILAFFFLKDKNNFGKAILQMIESGRNRRFLRGVFDDLDLMLAVYIRAQLLLSLFAIIAYTAFLLVVRFPYAIVTGLAAGLLEFIPFVGPLITAVIILGIGFLTSYPHLVLVLGFIVVWRLIQDYVNTPWVMGEGLDLDPAIAIVAVLIGGEVGGVAGMFLSVPVVAALRIFWKHWKLREEITRPAAPAADFKEAA
jgi:predicted PurR-regulated permease PerM